jgi:hypothetical protein
MGVDVAFYPVDFGEDETGFSSFSLLGLERRRELWEPLTNVPSYPCKSLTGHIGDEFGDRKEDCYGTSLRYAFAADLMALNDHKSVQDNPKNRAVWAYLAALPSEAKVVIWWH